MKRRNSFESILSLTTVKTCPEPVTSQKVLDDSLSNASMPLSFLDKPLGHRAQQAMLRQGPPKQLYHTTKVVAASTTHTSTTNKHQLSTEIAITNSLHSSLKPRKQQQQNRRHLLTHSKSPSSRKVFTSVKTAAARP